MNEIEKLILGVGRPSPSRELDERISRLKPASQRTIKNPPRAARIGVMLTWTAFVGLVGFVLGQRSVTPAMAINQQVASMESRGEMVQQTPVTIEGKPKPESVRIEELSSEVVARFVMLPRQTEGLFGRGPLIDPEQASHLD